MRRENDLWQTMLKCWSWVVFRLCWCSQRLDAAKHAIPVKRVQRVEDLFNGCCAAVCYSLIRIAKEKSNRMPFNSKATRAFSAHGPGHA